MNKRLIAINLPQFHPFKENDEWWGIGFTEWTNVTKAKPRFRGHYQPHLPTETGFYDLRLPEARQMQADMAREAGIYGFCYYHYWFNGHRLMERPVNEILSSGEPDFPFMLCWANENWARNWDGGFSNVLIEQNYNTVDDANHMEYLCTHVFNDPRYIKVNGKPFFIVYKPFLFPDIQKTISVWREVARKHGIELYLGFMRHDKQNRSEILACGFDVAVEFQPDWITKDFQPKWKRVISYIYNCIFKGSAKLGIYIEPTIKVSLYDYGHYIQKQVECLKKCNLKQYPCVTPSWDNSARRVNKTFTAFYNSTPTLYKDWLKKVLCIFEPYSTEENFVFINAWNEWAEGNHLEPDIKWGRSYLLATKEAIDETH